MKTRLPAFVLLVVLAAPAFAEPMKLTYAQIAVINQGLGALDGYQQIVKTGAQEQVVPTPYDFAVGTRIAIASDLVQLQTILMTQQSDLRVVAKSLGSAVQTAGSPEQAQFNEAVQKVSDKSFDVDLVKFNVAELKLEKNAIPSSVLATLAPILNDLGGAK